ncbi:hypothetical protein A1O3_03450 [Capronia epimyces CBS 606.96]|uniref:Fcf2 pre-rRNA processing C-terminal domain-containing protein n=1 Tax=Capronia epimyces CBS 606.96 TaxID=1182542 RepID=W9YW39_9EURO|nr:uncharacterized protein A1O3_03450 [Capronia epimyces CBS 606.96]EXJ86499.1 hypothetical protein A1O3_03450 [Capronia epimyces CBS 606.96]
MSEILTDEQIDQLLAEAEARLREQAVLLSTPSGADEISLDTTEAKAKERKPLPKLRHGLGQQTYIKDNQGVALTKPQATIPRDQRKLADGLRPVEVAEKSKKINDQLSAGPDWFDLPKTNLTPQLKRDLQLIQMRSVLDPHRHYKKNNRKGKVPTFSQTGTVIEGPTEFYSSRINKKDRHKTFVEEAIAAEKENGRLKRKYSEVQEAKTSGQKAHYKKVLAKRKKKP